VCQTLHRGGYPWADPSWVQSTGSTNVDILNMANAPEGTALIAGEQTAGRGRLGRTWTSAPGTGLWCSVLVRPQGEVVPLVAGVAVARALGTWADIQLKWPNDVVTTQGKLGGILAEVGDGVAVGIGINLTEAPVPGAVCLADCAEPVPDIESVCVAVLSAFAQAVAEARQDPGMVLAEYRARSATLGRRVAVEVPGGETIAGTAVEIDEHGHLVLETAYGLRTVSAGDVIHATLRP
jgi:BirA family biotin operon repressor/biotin-[acetyl-CoA-carboxylase] ligase